jgi:MerR family transcriptional regulator, copper efflux regulator
MSKNLTIGETAKEIGLPPKTIRFYEEVGVIKPPAREDNSYRRFSERDIERLRLVKRARDLGLPLDEIKNIVSECIGKGCLEARQYVAAKVPEYIQDIDTRLAELQALKEEFQSLQEHYQENNKEWVHSTDACCEILPNTTKG